jgi:hypothetical protein
MNIEFKHLFSFSERVVSTFNKFCNYNPGISAADEDYVPTKNSIMKIPINEEFVGSVMVENLTFCRNEDKYEYKKGDVVFSWVPYSKCANKYVLNRIYKVTDVSSNKEKYGSGAYSWITLTAYEKYFGKLIIEESVPPGTYRYRKNAEWYDNLILEILD